MTACVATDEQRQYCLNRVLQINPNNDNARTALEKIRGAFYSSVAELVPQVAVNRPVSSSIQFIPAKCPNCGGELRVPMDREVVKCMYCGFDIIIENKNHIVVETKVNTEMIFSLATAAEKGKNFQEAYGYYSQILESETENADAWLGKGRCAGWLSTVTSPRIEEAVRCIIKGSEIGSANPEMVKASGKELIYNISLLSICHSVFI